MSARIVSAAIDAAPTEQWIPVQGASSALSQHLYLISPLPSLSPGLWRQVTCRLFCNKNSLL